MRALLVVNPAATTTTARTREVLASALRGRAQARGGADRGTAATRPSWPRQAARATGWTWSSRSAATAPSTRSSTACSPTARSRTCRRWRWCPAAAPTSSPAPSVSPRPGRGHRRDPRRAARPAPPQHRPRHWPTTLVHLQRRPRPATPRSSHAVEQRRRAGRQPAPDAAVRAGRPLAQFFLHTGPPAPGAHPGAPGRGAGRGPAPARSSRTPRRGPTSGDRPLRPCPRRPSTPGSTSSA